MVFLHVGSQVVVFCLIKQVIIFSLSHPFSPKIFELQLFRLHDGRVQCVVSVKCSDVTLCKALDQSPGVSV